MGKKMPALTYEYVLAQIQETSITKHPSKSPSSLLEQALRSTAAPLYRPAREIRPGSSEWSDLVLLAERLVPYIEQNGIDGKDAIYAKGNIAKSRHAANYLRPFLKHPTAKTKPVVAAVMQDLADKGVSKAVFVRRYTRPWQNQAD